MGLTTLIGIGCVVWGISCLFVKNNKFIVTKDISGVTTIKDKETGKKYIQYNNNNVTEI